MDIKAVAEIAHKHPGILVVVDNTFMSPYLQVGTFISFTASCINNDCQNPLSLGADIVVHSVTKVHFRVKVLFFLSSV